MRGQVRKTADCPGLRALSAQARLRRSIRATIRLPNGGRRGGGTQASAPKTESIEIQIDDRGRVESERLAEDQAPDDRNAQRLSQFAPFAQTDCERNGAE